LTTLPTLKSHLQDLDRRLTSALSNHDDDDHLRKLQSTALSAAERKISENSLRFASEIREIKDALSAQSEEIR